MLSKFYSLDECYSKDKVFDHLENLQNDEMILFEIIDQEVIKIRDIGLSEKDIKDLVIFFEENDVIEYSDLDEDDEDEDSFFDDDYYPNDDVY